MKQILILTYFIFTTINILSQENTCIFENTVWKIKKIEIKRMDASIKDSIYISNVYLKLDSTRFYFDDKKNIRITWGKYSKTGKFKIVSKSASKSLEVTFTRMKYYDYGNNDKLLFGNFLYSFLSSKKNLLENCTLELTDVRLGNKVMIKLEMIE